MKIRYLIAAPVAVILIYVLYVILSYDRIPDMQALSPVSGTAEEAAETGRAYTVVTQNCGFGAYSPDFTFFMDGGSESWAESKESVIANTDAAAEEVLSFDPDFVLLQEIDTDSTRSYHVDQSERMAGFFEGFDRVFAVNYHSAFLMYPFTQPHGASNSGIMTFSRFPISSALRRSLTISTGFSKFLDLDRCYSVSRIPVKDGKELVLYNIHSSAYGGSDEIRTAQITQLTEDMLAEYKKGSYCVCSGDFNHDFTGDSAIVLGGSGTGEFGWAQPFPAELLPEGISRCIDYDDESLVATCRNCDVPYGPDCKVFVVDGFLVSDNVSVLELHNVDTGFAYSDHQPVVMRFQLGE